MPIGLLALALGGFGIGLTEFGIVGLLPEIAGDFHVSEPVAGYLVSGYALSVALGALALTVAITRFDRKKVLLSLMVLFIAGNLISAIAPTYSVLLLGRIVAALCHGAFFSVGAVVAADMVAENRRAGAISLMFGGLTVANVLGVPLGTFLGQQLGWRSTFWAITIIGLVALAGIALLVPSAPAPAGTSLRGELGAFRRPQVWISAAVSVLAFGSVVGAYTYIAFTLTEVSHFATSTVPWLLILFGAGTFVGNFVGGKAADRALNPALATLLALLSVVLAVFALTAGNKIMTIVSLLLMGTVGLATAPGLQLRTMKHAQDAPTMASGANIAAFNIGNAIGAWLGGLALGAGFGYVSPLWVGAGLGVAGLAVLAAGSVRSRQPASGGTSATAVAAN
ncbi:DHA1 family inner membrane transport protein [Amycolatopsis bartoniae]|uniref:MFS transporter n=1 Tax=Amycolatopsis bartoniae TaxID=941986 RepID=A0A8H9IRQ6_9PSEU|nr:MFS transporter [Amycolatopsis bartoniae]MBB2936812.1 DHA1 family inner membrane transport protein [Amycolatopsis bartoniae]TVT09145.1 MFS transporter [Amycolatopsis bartoniae]GHF50314.1 MFS transporter [Amycolatopsis bartoniae]